MQRQSMVETDFSKKQDMLNTQETLDQMRRK